MDDSKAIWVKGVHLQVLVTSLGGHFDPQLWVEVPSEVRGRICSVDNLAHGGPMILLTVPRGATKSVFLVHSLTHDLLCTLKLARFSRIWCIRCIFGTRMGLRRAQTCMVGYGAHGANRAITRGQAKPFVS